MPGQTHQTPATDASKTTAPSVETAPTQTTPATSNQEEQDKVRGKNGTKAGLEKYQATLGQWLGGELYQAIAPLITFEAMQGYANDGLDAAIDSGVGALGKADGIDASKLAGLSDALQKEYDKTAGNLLDSELGHKITGKLAGWVDAHPGLIVTIALLAAAGAVLADMDIPKLKQKFKIAEGLTANVEAELGSLRNIALEQIKMGLEYKSGPLLAAVNMSRNENGDISAKANASVEGTAGSVKADVEYADDKIKAFGVQGALNLGEDTKLSGGVSSKDDKEPVYEGKLVRKDGSVTDIDEVKYDANSGIATFTDTQILDLAAGSMKMSNSASSDGSGKLDLSGQHKLDDNLMGNWGLSNTIGADGSETQGMSGGLKYDNKQSGLNLGLDGKYNSLGAGSLNGTFGQKFDNGLQLGGNAGVETFADKDAIGNFGLDMKYGDDKSKLNFGLDTKLNTEGEGHVGGNFGYRPNKDLSFSGSGKYQFGEESKYNLAADMKYGNGGNRFELGGSYANGRAPDSEKLNLNALGQYQLNPNWALQSTLNYTHDSKGDNFKAGLNAARRLDENWQLTGGVDQSFGSSGSDTRFKMGAQFQKWNVQGYYSTKGEAGLMLGIPF